MNTKTTFYSLILSVLMLLVTTTQSSALNYTISFTASGITPSVGSVQVQNLTRGTTVTVPEGYTLTLSDQITAINSINAHDGGIRISQNTRTGTSTLTFYASQAGKVQVAAYALDGKKSVEQTTRSEVGDNSLELSLPVGMYVIRVFGTGYSYSAKLQSQKLTANEAKIKFVSQTKTASKVLQKSKGTETPTTYIGYSEGEQLLYTAASGPYIASVPDVSTGDKTINFNFTTIPTSAIPSGSFTMGSPDSEVNRLTNEVQHFVTLDAFRMSKYEISNTQYASFLNAKSIGVNGSYATKNYGIQTLIYASSGNYDWGLHYNGSQWVPVAGYEDAPVIYVTWYGASEFATYVGGTLPTEAQWEYACRAGTTTPFNTGNFLTNLQANYDWAYPYNGGTNTVTTYPGKNQTVGTYAANAYGLYDMHGNVWEWCADRYGAYPTTPQTNPTGATTGSFRVNRGGSWGNLAQICRSAIRTYGYPSDNFNFIGFRVVFVP